MQYVQELPPARQRGINLSYIDTVGKHMAGWVPIQSYNRDMVDANASSRDRNDYRRRWNEAEDEIDVLKQRIKELESTAAPSFAITSAKTMSSSHNSAPAPLSRPVDSSASRIKVPPQGGPSITSKGKKRVLPAPYVEDAPSGAPYLGNDPYADDDDDAN